MLAMTMKPTSRIQLGLPKGNLMAKSNPKRRMVRVPKIIPRKQKGFIGLNERLSFGNQRCKSKFQTSEYSPTQNTCSTSFDLLGQIILRHFYP